VYIALEAGLSGDRLLTLWLILSHSLPPPMP